MLAKYGNKGTFTKQATAQSAGYTNYAVHGQVHFFGLRLPSLCRELHVGLCRHLFMWTTSLTCIRPLYTGNCASSSSYKNCCTNWGLMENGFDFNKFSKGNSCRGDGDRDYVTKQVKVDS